MAIVNIEELLHVIIVNIDISWLFIRLIDIGFTQVATTLTDPDSSKSDGSTILISCPARISEFNDKLNVYLLLSPALFDPAETEASNSVDNILLKFLTVLSVFLSYFESKAPCETSSLSSTNII